MGVESSILLGIKSKFRQLELLVCYWATSTRQSPPFTYILHSKGKTAWLLSLSPMFLRKSVSKELWWPTLSGCQVWHQRRTVKVLLYVLVSLCVWHTSGLCSKWPRPALKRPCAVRYLKPIIYKSVLSATALRQQKVVNCWLMPKLWSHMKASVFTV